MKIDEKTNLGNKEIFLNNSLSSKNRSSTKQIKSKKRNFNEIIDNSHKTSPRLTLTTKAQTEDTQNNSSTKHQLAKKIIINKNTKNQTEMTKESQLKAEILKKEEQK